MLALFFSGPAARPAQQRVPPWPFLSAKLRRLSTRLGWMATLAVTALLALPVGKVIAGGPAELSAADARAVRAVIEAQLQAFAKGDGERAFSYATAAIRSQFGDAPTFMAMVLAGYPMVIRPTRLAFFAPREADGTVLQTVQMRDRDGALWRATYQMQQTVDGWRINGCAVLADDGKSST